MLWKQRWRKMALFSQKLKLQILEKRKATKEAHGEIETEYPGYLGSQDTVSGHGFLSQPKNVIPELM